MFMLLTLFVFTLLQHGGHSGSYSIQTILCLVSQPNECSGKQVYDYARAEQSYISKCVEHIMEYNRHQKSVIVREPTHLFGEHVRCYARGPYFTKLQCLHSASKHPLQNT